MVTNSFEKSSSRGFTLIELLVVIAIIGILASIVLASLNSARSKGADSAIKSNLNNARAQAELFYYANNNLYTNVCVNTTVAGVKSIYANMLGAAQASGIAAVTRNGVGSAAVAVCNDGATGWAAQVPLEENTTYYYCVDSRGTATTTNVNRITAAADYLCL